MALTKEEENELKRIDAEIESSREAMQAAQNLSVDMLTQIAVSAVYPIEVMRRFAEREPNSVMGQRTQGTLASVNLWLTEYKSYMARHQEEQAAAAAAAEEEAPAGDEG